MEVALDLGTLEHVGLQGVSVYMVGVLKRAEIIFTCIQES